MSNITYNDKVFPSSKRRINQQRNGNQLGYQQESFENCWHFNHYYRLENTTEIEIDISKLGVLIYFTEYHTNFKQTFQITCDKGYKGIYYKYRFRL